jgi:hypothetical protein
VTYVASKTVDSVITFTDITTNNASTTKHGFLKKLNNDATYYMDGTGAWSIPAGGSTSNSFATIAVSGESDVVADSSTDTLTFVGAGGITITTNAGTDTITFTGGGGGGSTFDAIGDAVATGAVDNFAYAQTWDWSTLSTATGLSITAPLLSSGTILNITSNGTAGATGQAGIKITMTGVNGTSAQTTYAMDIINSHTGTTSVSHGIRVSTNGAVTFTSHPLIVIGHLGGGWKFGNTSSTYGAIYSANTTTPDANNYIMHSNGTDTRLTCPGGMTVNGQTRVSMTVNTVNVVYSEAYTALALCGATYTAAQITCGAALVAMAGTTARAGFRLTPGVAPTSPVNGDMWCDATDVYIRIGATTYTITKV